MSRVATTCLYTLFIILVGIIFVSSFIEQSFWLDECISYWIISSDSFAQVAERSWNFQGQSPLYFLLLKLWSQAFGNSEAILRGFSGVLLIFSAVLVYLLTIQINQRLKLEQCNNVAGLLSAACFISSTPILLSLSARPYALAIFFLLSSLYFSLKDGARSTVIAIFLAGLSVVTHYLFLFALMIFPIFFIARIISLRKALITSLGGTLFILPFFEHLTAIAASAKDWQYLDPPGVRLFLKILFQGHIGLAIILAVFFAILVKTGDRAKRDAKVSALWLTPLIFLPPVFFLALYLVWDINLFSERYLVWQSLGWCVVSGALLSIFAKSGRASYFALTLVAFLIFAEGGRSYHIEDWKGLSARLNELELDKVLFISPLVEARSVEKIEDLSPEKLQYLTAPLQCYPTTSLKAELYIATQFSPTDIVNYDAIIYSTGIALDQAKRLVAKLKELNLEYRIERFGEVVLVLVSRPGESITVKKSVLRTFSP